MVHLVGPWPGCYNIREHVIKLGGQIQGRWMSSSQLHIAIFSTNYLISLRKSVKNYYTTAGWVESKEFCQESISSWKTSSSNEISKERS